MTARPGVLGRAAPGKISTPAPAAQDHPPCGLVCCGRPVDSDKVCSSAARRENCVTSGHTPNSPRRGLPSNLTCYGRLIEDGTTSYACGSAEPTFSGHKSNNRATEIPRNQAPLGRPAGRRTPCIYGRRHGLDARRFRRTLGHPLRRIAVGSAAAIASGLLAATSTTDRARPAAQRLVTAGGGAGPVPARPHHRHDFLAASRGSLPGAGGRVLLRLRCGARARDDLTHPRGRGARAMGAVLARRHHLHRRLRRVFLVPGHPARRSGHGTRLPAPGAQPPAMRRSACCS